MRKILLCLLAVVAISCIKDPDPTGNVLDVGDRIPDFTVIMNDGSVVTAEYLRESVSCIIFFNTSCPDCQRLLPQMKEVYETYVREGVRFAFISREDAEPAVGAYWASEGYTMPYSAQSDRKVYELFAKTRVPRVYVSSDDGVIRAIFTDDPVPSGDMIAESLDAVL